jgi:DNA-binding NarL/FixJ family response regulator
VAIHQQKWTEREISILRKMTEQGYTLAIIAERLGRTIHSVHDKSKKLSLRPKCR